MKRIDFSKNFIKSYRKRITSNSRLVIKVDERIKLFSENPKDPSLRDHALTGNRKGERSFSITGDVRVVYMEYEDHYLFLDIGTHNQVY